MALFFVSIMEGMMKLSLFETSYSAAHSRLYIIAQKKAPAPGVHLMQRLSVDVAYRPLVLSSL
jgi:hypothetical protein